MNINSNQFSPKPPILKLLKRASTVEIGSPAKKRKSIISLNETENYISQYASPTNSYFIQSTTTPPSFNTPLDNLVQPTITQETWSQLLNHQAINQITLCSSCKQPGHKTKANKLCPNNGLLQKRVRMRTPQQIEAQAKKRKETTATRNLTNEINNVMLNYINFIIDFIYFN
jgi:hypothetical protein